MTHLLARRRFTQSHAAIAQTAIISCCFVSAITGCGSEQGPPRYHLSGKVVFQGKQVGFGIIYFQPDAHGGNNGPQGFAKIHDGAFDTRHEGKGSVGGAMIVRITGFESEPPKDLVTETGGPKPLFVEYQTKVDLPKEDSTKDFDVPASAADGPIAPPPAVPVGP